ncbi:hypothetical protein D3C87_2022430 [compost metagenome]
MAPIQLKNGSGSLSISPAMVARPSTSGPLKQEITAQARLPQCSRGNGSMEGTVLRPTKAPRFSGAVGRKSR